MARSRCILGAERENKMPHWTQQLKDENKALTEALAVAVKALREVPESRWQKYAGAGDDADAQGYRKAVGEIRDRNNNAVTEVNDILLDAGV